MHWVIHLDADGWASGVLCGCAIGADHYANDGGGDE